MPIINPWLFYLADVSETIRVTFQVVAGVSLVVSGVVLAISFFEGTPELFKRTIKAIFISIAILCIGSLFPKEETCYKMMAASLVTPENLQTVKGETQNIVNYIVKAVDQLLDDNEESK